MPLYTPEISDPVQYNKDLVLCRGYALKLPSSVSPTKLSQRAGEGGAKELAGAAVTWYAPVLGLLGGFSQEALEEFGLTDRRQQQAFVKCVDRKTEWDHSALEIEPPP